MWPNSEVLSYPKERPALGNSEPFLVGIGSRLLRTTKQRGEHFLQTSDEMVGFAGALGKVFDLIIFHGDFAAKKCYLTVLLVQAFFKLRDIACHNWS